MGGWATKRARARQGLFACGVLLTIAGCTALTSFDGLSSGGSPSPSIDGGADEGSSVTPPSDGSADADAGRPAPQPRKWRKLDVAGPSARHSARLAYDEALAKSVLVGGREPGGAKTDAWAWDGTTWSSISSPATPPQQAAGLVYDTDRKVVTLYGGRSSPPTPLEWSGQQWTAAPGAANGPPPSYAPGVAYDSARKVLVMFGGYQDAAKKIIDETWEWSASSGFTKRTLPLSPSARRGHIMVYDSDRSRILLFGGNATRPKSDVWEYDGNTWTERPIAQSQSPSPRLCACAAYDSANRVTVMFGGRSGDTTTVLGDTWEWDGTSWKKGPDGPPARRSCAMAFDKQRNAIVMYGGSPGGPSSGPPDALGDTWVYE